MKTVFKTIFFILLVIVVCVLTALYWGPLKVPVLQPAGAIADKERDLIIIASLLMLIVVIPVFVLTFVFAWRYREGNEKARHAPDWEHNYIAEYCWWGVPILIIIVLAVITWKSSHELNPFTPLVSVQKPVKIQAVALNWKWLFLYPEEGIATINFIQFPDKTPLNFEITSDAPMNSFWIPALGGQIYAMPAMRSKLHLIANKTGTFRGSSANISGEGFANMHFVAKATSVEEYRSWVQSVKQSNKRLGLKEYNQLLTPNFTYEPAAYFVLTEKDLFDKIMMKYMEPAHK